jgi:hypothetical protein
VIGFEGVGTKLEGNPMDLKEKQYRERVQEALKVDRLAAYLKEKGLLENIQQSPNQYKSTFPIQSGDTLSPVVRLIELTLDVLRDVDTPPRVKDKHLHYLAETLAEVDKTRI